MKVLPGGAISVETASEFDVDGELLGFINNTEKTFQVEVRRVNAAGPCMTSCTLPPHGGEYSLARYGGVLRGVYAVKVKELVTEPTRR